MDRRDLPANSPFSGEAWAAAIDMESSRKTAIAEEEHPTVHAADLEEMIGHVAEPAVAGKPAPTEQAEHVESPAGATVEEVPAIEEPAKKSALDTWFSTPPPNPWEDEAQKANRLASTWDTGLAAATHSDTGARGDVSFESAGAPDEIEVVPGAN